jgi:hypothetical protein
MVHACNRPPTGVIVQKHDPLFTQPLAAGNSRCPCQLRLIYEIVRHTFISTSRSAAVLELWTLGGSTHTSIKLTPKKMNMNTNIIDRNPRILLSVAALMLGFFVTVHAQNLIVDPSFELLSPAWSYVGIAGITGPGHTGTNCAYVNAQEPSIPGSVSQTVNTVVGQSYTVDFWLKASQDFTLGGSGNGYNDYEVAVSFGDTIGFSTNYVAPPTFDWTEYSFTAVATAPTTTFSFAVNNIASTFYLDDVSVILNTSPSPTVFIYSAVEVNWLALPNVNYQVQWSSDLSSTNWQSLGAPVTGAGTNVSIFDSTRYSSKRFYRVQTLQ